MKRPLRELEGDLAAELSRLNLGERSVSVIVEAFGGALLYADE